MVEVSIISKFHEEDEKLNNVISIVSHSWAPQVIHRLDYYRKLRYNELKGSLKGVSSTSLSRVLNDLTLNNVIKREVMDTNPPQAHYSLTKKGNLLAKLLAEAIEVDKEISEHLEEENIAALAK